MSRIVWAMPRKKLLVAISIVIICMMAAIALFVVKPLYSRESASFDNKEYAAYLIQVTNALKQDQDTRLTFDNVTRIAVSLDKLDAWETTGKELRELLHRYPEGQFWLDAARMLLQDDPTGLLPFVASRMPEPQSLTQAVQILREHGYPFAANVLNVLAPDLPGKRIVALLSIPKAKRDLIEQTLLHQVADPPNRLMLARAALELVMRPPDGLTIDTAECYALALRLGEGTNLVSFETAQQLAQAGKGQEAFSMTTQLARDSAEDLIVQRQAADFMRRQGDATAVIAFYQQALETVPEPQRREIRLDYLAYVKWLKRTNDIATVQTGQDALFAGDAWLMEAKCEPAARCYTKVLEDRQAPLEKRIAAWTGLLDANPTQALHTGNNLVKEVSHSDKANASTLLIWIGRQLWIAASREIPPKPGTFTIAPRQGFCPMHESDGWESHAASIATSLLAADPVACLRIDSRITPQSFRYPAAMLYALAGNEEAAVEILTRHIEYEIPAPPGGWRIFDGTPRPDANKPRTRTTPTPKETQHDTMQLLEDLARCPNAAERIPPLSLVIVRTLTEQIHTTENDADLRMYMSTLATVLKMTVVAMDPLPRVLRTDQPAPPAHEVDMARFTPLCDVVREVLTDDKVAKCGLLLVNDGLRDALLTVRNPALLQALTTLSITCIERYAQAHQRPHYATDARLSLANYLSGRKGYDMTPYITQLTAAATE